MIKNRVLQIYRNRSQSKMLRQFLVGAGASVCNITVHALVMAAVVRVAQFTSAKHTSRPSLRLVGVMMAVVSVLMAAHALWAPQRLASIFYISPLLTTRPLDTAM